VCHLRLPLSDDVQRAGRGRCGVALGWCCLRRLPCLFPHTPYFSCSACAVADFYFSISSLLRFANLFINAYRRLVSFCVAHFAWFFVRCRSAGGIVCSETVTKWRPCAAASVLHGHCHHTRVRHLHLWLQHIHSIYHAELFGWDAPSFSFIRVEERFSYVGRCGAGAHRALSFLQAARAHLRTRRNDRRAKHAIAAAYAETAAGLLFLPGCTITFTRFSRTTSCNHPTTLSARALILPCMVSLVPVLPALRRRRRRRRRVLAGLSTNAAVPRTSRAACFVTALTYLLLFSSFSATLRRAGALLLVCGALFC